ncbi:MAG: vitamin K epoxide reductase family protein [Candidatus Micrarchaeota archaeon]
MNALASLAVLGNRSLPYGLAGVSFVAAASPVSMVRPFGLIDVLFYLLFYGIPVLSAIGLLISLYILYTQRTGKTLRCIIGNSCDIVTKSPYSKTFGIENSVMGALFYAFMLAAFAIAIPMGVQVPFHALLVLSVIASAFSLYLVYVQFLVLHQICDYCMLSAFINWAMTLIIGAVFLAFASS